MTGDEFKMDRDPATEIIHNKILTAIRLGPIKPLITQYQIEQLHPRKLPTDHVFDPALLDEFPFLEYSFSMNVGCSRLVIQWPKDLGRIGALMNYEMIY